MGQNIHEVVKLHAYGEIKIYKLTVVMRLLVNWKYCEVIRIKTGTEPATVLKVSFKKHAEFDASYEAFKAMREKRKEERARAAALKKTEDAAQSQEDEVKAEASLPHDSELVVKEETAAI